MLCSVLCCAYLALGCCQVSLRDFYEAIENTKPSVSQEHIARYGQWDEDFGSK